MYERALFCFIYYLSSLFTILIQVQFGLPKDLEHPEKEDKWLERKYN